MEFAHHALTMMENNARQACATGGNRPILLKKSAIVSTVEKYALEIEIFTLSRGIRGSDFA
jgi:hypothetical protein